MLENSLKRSVPEKQGVSSEDILTFLEKIEQRQLELHGFMFLRHDHVIAEGWWAPYQPEYPHVAYSLTKSFTSTAVGFAVHEGLISVNDPVLPYFPEEVTEEIRQNMGELTIKHLLSMSTGHTEDTTRFNVHFSFLEDRPDVGIGNRPDGDWVRGFFDLPIKRSPGSYFIYNSGASHLLATIVQKVTHQNILDYLQQRLFSPLGIPKPSWETCPMGNISGGWGLRLRTEDIARFGQLLLRKGMWNGKRILPEAWIAEATKKQVETLTNDTMQSVTGVQDWLQGYGYHFWMCRHNAYRGDGAMGQFCLVIPEKDVVIATNAGVADMQGIMDAIWEHLLPAMKEEEILIDDTVQKNLQHKLATLAIGEQDSLNRVIFKGVKRYRIEPNEDQVEEIVISFDKKNCSFVWKDAAGEHLINIGIGEWNGQNQLAGEKVAAKGVWRDGKTFIIDLCRIYTPYHDRVICTFEGNTLQINHEHLDFVPKQRNLIGELA